METLYANGEKPRLEMPPTSQARAESEALLEAVAGALHERKAGDHFLNLRARSA